MVAGSIMATPIGRSTISQAMTYKAVSAFIIGFLCYRFGVAVLVSGFVLVVSNIKTLTLPNRYQ